MRYCSICKIDTGSKASKCRPHAAEYQQQRAYKLRLSVQKYKVENGCADCGYNKHHAGLEFDHRDGEVKLNNVSKFAMQGNVNATWEEITKCDVICGTCHGIRTWDRFHNQRGIVNQPVQTSSSSSSCEAASITEG